jgi:hypothetical protein
MDSDKSGLDGHNGHEWNGMDNGLPVRVPSVKSP